jgi:hypothetical protein
VELPGAESCGGAAAVAKAVEQRLGRGALVSPAQADLSIEGRAERVGTGLRAVLVLRDGSGAQLGVRELESAATDCSELRENAALAIALMIDPDAVLRPPPAPSTPATVAPPAPEVVIERVEVPAPEPERPAPWQVRPAAGVIIGHGFLPSTSVGALVSTTLAPPKWWPATIYAGVWAAQGLTAEGAASVSFTSAFVGLGVCPLRTKGAAASFQACAAGQLGAVQSSPSGFTTASGGALPTVHLVADAHLTFALIGNLSAQAGGSLAAALLRSQFVFDSPGGSQMLFDAPEFAATADLGLAVVLR